MIVIIERRMMSLLIKKDDGMLTRQVFAEMDDKRALGLIREYGYRQEQVYGIVHETIALRHEVDDQLVEEVLQRMPYRECHSAEAMLWAVRCIVPQATRIVTRHRGNTIGDIKELLKNLF